MNKPLEGIRVIEMGGHVAVPKAARMMADWGAEVIKVEPLQGDARRTTGLIFDVPAGEDCNVLFQPENAGKKGIVLNLKDPEGKEALMKLLADADIFMTNTRPQPLVKLGIDYEALKDKFPKLIYAQFSGFGLVGPDKDRPGFDLTAHWARSGALVSWSTKESAPFRPAAGFGDCTSASLLLNGILVAMLNRAKTGKGDFVDLSLYGAALWFDSTGLLTSQKKFGKEDPASRFSPPSPVGPYYMSKDGDYFLISITEWDKQSPTLYELMGAPELKDDPAYTTLEGCRKHMPEVVAKLDEIIGKRSTQEVWDALTEMDIVFEKLGKTSDVPEDPQAWENDYLEEITLENGLTCVIPKMPLHFANIEAPTFHLAPQFGEHTADVLKEAGYADDQIKAMAEKKAVVAK